MMKQVSKEEFEIFKKQYWRFFASAKADPFRPSDGMLSIAYYDLEKRIIARETKFDNAENNYYLINNAYNKNIIPSM